MGWVRGAAVKHQSGPGPGAGLVVCLNTVSGLLCCFPEAPVFIETSALLASSGRECRSSRSIKSRVGSQSRRGLAKARASPGCFDPLGSPDARLAGARRPLGPLCYALSLELWPWLIYVPSPSHREGEYLTGVAEDNAKE